MWLGQAGFALSSDGCLVLIDPYLSDHLAVKYKGTDKPHVRLMPPPVRADEIPGVTVVLCTHRHGDHMDPVALPVLAKHNPACRFIVPKADVEQAEALGLVVTGMNADETVTMDGVTITAIAAAHEELKVNARGEHHWLGYIVRMGGKTIYHSGDCVPYEGLPERLATERIDVALLPVNGRGKGVPGNFTFEEAVALCRAARIPALVAHHFGMFAFNTVDEAELERKLAGLAMGLRAMVPRVNERYAL
jgi:L-ascorbate metabolism protein UlaG (beta-lactamase superfamily)